MAITTEIADIQKEFISLFYENRQLLEQSSVHLINKHRDAAIEAFRKNGLPDKKHENYKYSDIVKLFSQDFKKQFLPKKIDFDINQIFKCDIPELDTNLSLILNGYYYEKQPYLVEYDNGALVGSLAAAASKYPELLEKHYNQYAENEKESITALNTAFAQDGFFVYVPRNAALEKPIQVVNLLMSNENMMVQHRDLYILEENASAEVIICDHTLSPHRFLTNSVSEIHTGPNARLDLTKMQNEHNQAAHLAGNFVMQEKDSTVSINTITLHGGFIRNNNYVTLNGKSAEHNAYGLFLSDKNQHVDNYVFMDHAVPNCQSTQLYKGILDEIATGAFNGKILVRNDAQNTNAYQTNNNILLTDTAKIKSKPTLEIYADDVKCSHGATIGRLDEDALFYLRSRGIGKNESRLLLMYAFADEIISKLHQNALRERVSELVDKRLRGELSRCNNCTMNCC